MTLLNFKKSKDEKTNINDLALPSLIKKILNSLKKRESLSF